MNASSPHADATRDAIHDGTQGAPAHCWRCRFFAISWHPRQPYACRRLGFRSRSLPCLVVLQADGHACRGFVPKSELPAESGASTSGAAVAAAGACPPAPGACALPPAQRGGVN